MGSLYVHVWISSMANEGEGNETFYQFGAYPKKSKVELNQVIVSEK